MATEPGHRRDAPNLRERLRQAEREITARGTRLEILEGEVSERRRRYAELFETVPAAYFVTNQYGKIEEANRTAADLLGHDVRFLVGKPLATYTPLEGRRAFRLLLLSLSRPGPSTRFPLTLKSRDGDHFEVMASISLAFGPSSAVHRISWLMRPTAGPAADRPNEADLARTLEYLVHDRTAELTAAAHRLENERALLEDVVRQMPNGVLVVDAVTHRPSIGNNALESLIGVAPDEIDADHPALAPLRRTLKTGEAVKAAEVEVEQPEGRSRRLEVNSAPIYNASGELIAAVATFDDLDARERRDRAQRDFVANAAHGLQNPLTVISTAVEILQSGAKDDPDERDRFLAHIERETARLTRLTRALLRLARVESGAEPVRKKVVELHPLLVRLAGRLRPLSRVPVEVDCPSDLALVTNAELLEEALVNLGENSAKYTERGSIRLVAEPVGDDLARVSVHDTGPGIPEEEWERVFERFARGHPSGGEGFGIGLALVGQIAAALDAELEVGSNDGKGSSFSLVVPAMRMVPA